MPRETVTEQRSFLQDLSSSMESEIERLSRESERPEHELIEAQSELTGYEQGREQFQQAVTLARETYEAPSRKAAGSIPGEWGRCARQDRGTGNTPG